MTNHPSDISLGKAAIVAGLGLLIMTVCYISADLFVFKNLIVPGDATTTANNIMANEMQFRTGILGFLIVILCDLVVAWALYVFLQPTNKSLSLLAAWFRLVYTIIFGVTLVNYFNVLQLLSGADYLNVFEADQLNVQVLLSLYAFNDGWDIGFIFFGFHLALLGYLAFKSDYIPRILGILLMVAGLSYLLDTISKFLFPSFDVAISVVTGWGELLFMFWLLFKGRNVQRTH